MMQAANRAASLRWRSLGRRLLWLCSSGCDSARSGAARYGYASSGCSETLRGRLSNVQRFGSDACVCCRVASFAPCTNDAVFRMTSGRPSLGPRRGLLPEIGSRLPVPFDATRRSPVFFYTSSGRTHERRHSCGASGQPLPDCQESHLELTSVGQGFGLPLRSVSAARNTHTTILELPLQR